MPEGVFRYPVFRRSYLQGDIFPTESWRAGSSVNGPVSIRQPMGGFRFFRRICPLLFSRIFFTVFTRIFTGTLRRPGFSAKAVTRRIRAGSGPFPVFLCRLLTFPCVGRFPVRRFAGCRRKRKETETGCVFLPAGKRFFLAQGMAGGNVRFLCDVRYGVRFRMSPGRAVSHTKPPFIRPCMIHSPISAWSPGSSSKPIRVVLAECADSRRQPVGGDAGEGADTDEAGSPIMRLPARGAAGAG